MSDFLHLDDDTSPRTLWIDSTAYTARLLEGGAPAWLDVANYLAWQRKAQSLVRSDVIALAVAPVVAAVIDAQPQLRTAMAAKTRALFPLKTLLADAQVRGHLLELLAGLRACFLGLPLVLTIPSPRNWISQSYEQAHGAGGCPELGSDDVDAASMYVADFLRVFSEAGLDGLLLVESANDEPQSAEEVDWYRPVLNVAKHYRWATGIRLAKGLATISAVDGLSFFIAPRGLGITTGITTPESFWSDGSVPSCGARQFRFVEIPSNTNPERVLERLGMLRQPTAILMEDAQA